MADQTEDVVELPPSSSDAPLPVVCDSCGVEFSVPLALSWRHERIGRSIWCPNGHLLGADFSEPVSTLLQRAHELASELHTELWLERNAHVRTHRELVDLRHQLTLGRCPACTYESKTFGNHVRKQHPDFDAEGI